MSAVLTRIDLREQIDRFLAGTLSDRALAAWAFDQFYAGDAGTLAYEEGFEDVIDAALDELMWIDSVPFQLDAASARALQQRLGQ